MKIFHIELAKTGTGLSGGEKCMVEIIRYFTQKKLVNVILTTDNGKELYERLGLKEDEYIKYITIDSFWTESKFHIFISYILRLFYFGKIKKSIIASIDRESDVLMCHSDFFPNTIPSWELSKYFNKKTFYWFHMKAPDIWRGYMGEFTGKFHLPNIRIIHYKLNQVLFNLISKKGIIISVNPYYKSLFKKKGTYLLKKFGGEQVYTINKYSGVKAGYTQETEIKYDLAFMGRFHPQKGLDEIPKILKEIKSYKPDVKLVIIGGGDEAREKKLLKELNALGLQENFYYAGYISSDEKFDYLRSAKVFVFPSYYESFGQVALEAMANGLPVVAYNLPIFNVFEEGMIKVPVLDNVAFAKETYKLLSDPDYYNKMKSEASSYAATFSWDKTGEEIYKLIMGIS